MSVTHQPQIICNLHINSNCSYNKFKREDTLDVCIKCNIYVAINFQRNNKPGSLLVGSTVLLLTKSFDSFDLNFIISILEKVH